MTDAQSIIFMSASNAGSSSAEAYALAFPSNHFANSTFNNYTYVKSGVTKQRQVGLYVQYPFPSGSATSSANLFSNGVLVSSSKQANEVRYGTSTDLHTRGQFIYHITGSTIIPKGVAKFASASLGLGPANTTAKVSIPISYFTPLFNSSIEDSNDLNGISILSYNGVISTIGGYNQFSSSILNDSTSSFAVFYVSASKANMGNIAGNDLYLSLGRTQLPTGPSGRIRVTAEAIDEFPGGGTGAVTFDGVSQYFTALNSEVVSWLPGTGDFTIEFFIKNGTQTVGAPRVFSLGFDTGATIGISIEGGYVYVWPYGSSLRGSLPASYNNGTAWMHVAICRSGTTTKLYMNGTLKATETGDSRDINDSINPGYDLNVGVDNPIAMSPNWWGGKLTNFRWDNSAIYTGASLTVPTSPLSKTATTKLLMLGGGVSNPVFDAAKLNILVNHGSVWDAETPFV